MKSKRHDHNRQILGRVKRDEFVGRAKELERIVSHALPPADARQRESAADARGLLVLMAPMAGVSELLRQAFDNIFNRREKVAPIYFSLPQTETTAVSAAIEFLNTFLLQYIAFRRDEPALCQLSLTLNELVQLAPAGDLDWIEKLVDAYNLQRFGKDDRELVRFCLSAPRRVPANIARPVVLLDIVHLSNYYDSPVPLAIEIVRALQSGGSPFVLAGLRREVLDAVARAGGSTDALEVMKLDALAEEDARLLLTSAARRQTVSLNDETRDLLVQQLEGSPFFITAFLQAAHEKNLPLDSYLTCERLYVDELMGGRLNRHFSSVLERIAPEPETRAALVRLLCEAVPSGQRTSSFESWRKRAQLEGAEVEQILRALHIQELINWDGETVNAEGGSAVWKDYLRSRFRLDALREPRALVVADVMADALKRAPQTIARHYRRAAGLRLRDLLGKLNAQLVPRTLFNFPEFAASYKGVELEEITVGLDTETDLLRLPQVFHAASGVSFSPELRLFGEESCVVAHAFEGATYTDANEVVWLAAKVESKLAADRTAVEKWCERLDKLALESGFVRTQIWLIANEGFDEGASELLRGRRAYSSSQQQFELLTARLSEAEGAAQGTEEENEFVLILPMGADNELLAATTVEQVARRLNFTPEAINQIKTAVVEACISLSLERKIYQRFRVENDKLVITVSSRGIVPANINGNAPARAEEQSDLRKGGMSDETEQRRGWGLKLIRTLMDEVEFERVDEGTSLRMTKYLRKSSA
jgi:anti-sigma regulatory factor (Ser/Thr protein kinase)